MTAFEIITTVLMSTLVVVLLFWLVFVITKTRVGNKKSAILSHRELWLYYMNNADLASLLGNNNGKGINGTISPEKMTEKQYRFLVLFLNHMEYMIVLISKNMLPSKISFEKDWIELFKNDCLRKVYENTKSYREKCFCNFVDKIIAGYDK